MINKYLNSLPSPLTRGEPRVTGPGVRGLALSTAYIISLAHLILLVCIGCEPAARAPRDDYTPHAAVTLGQASIDNVAPAPTPKPSNGKCKNCKGVGKVGDGRTMLTCDVCKGTGKDTGDLPSMMPFSLPSSLPPAAALDPNVGNPIDDPAAFTIPVLTPPTYAIPKPIPKPEPEPSKPTESQVDRASAEPDKPPEKLVSTPIDKPGEQPKAITPTITVWTRPNCEPCDRWKVIEAPKFRKGGWTIDEQIATTGLTPRFDVNDSRRSFQHTGYMTVEAFNAKYFAKPSSN